MKVDRCKSEERRRFKNENRGQYGEQARVYLEIQKIADLAFIGYPNAGKSTLMKALTNHNVQDCIARTMYKTYRD